MLERDSLKTMTPTQAAELMRRAAGAMLYGVAYIDVLGERAVPNGGLQGDDGVYHEEQKGQLYGMAELLDSAAVDLAGEEEIDWEEDERPNPVSMRSSGPTDEFADAVLDRLDQRLFDAGFTQLMENTADSDSHAPILRQMLRRSIADVLEGRITLVR